MATAKKPRAAKPAKPPKAPKSRDLTVDLSRFLAKTLLSDLEARAKEPEVHAALLHQHATEQAEHRTADSFDEWATRTLEQIGVAWILSCVFVRTLEDRGYLTHPRLVGEAAQDSERLFFELFPSLGVRDYLLMVFAELAHLPGAEAVLGRSNNPAWRLAPSGESLRALLDFLRETDTEGGLVWKFGGPGSKQTTRFLGDLYQDISASVRERYALLQTPDFVEEFILDRTLEPAIKQFGLSQTTLLDPTCGSGHFLLGAFARLFEHYQRTMPYRPNKELAGLALAQVYGSDINPYAAAIARFRLVLAYLEAAEIEKLKSAPPISPNVIVADSLLPLNLAASSENPTLWGESAFAFEDPRRVREILGRRYHAVVGNPPYITCKDPVLRERYREAYESAAGKYALAAPFTERFFRLAIDGGFVGLINANSFMKREFGKKLIEQVLPQFELTQIIDTAGAYIPGHGTPTVLLFGLNRPPISAKVTAVLGKRGEPSTPEDASQGLVWSSIRDHFAEVGFENDYISVAEVPRETFNKHPWSLGGGGAAELKELLEQRAEKRLGDISTIGVGGMSNADDVFIADTGAWKRFGLPPELVRSLVIGEEIRDWNHHPSIEVYFPYDSSLKLVPPTGRVLEILWPYRTTLWARAVFSGGTYRAAKRPWWEWHQVTVDRYRTPLSITFAEVATHNHFVLDRGGKVFKQTAPIIKLPESATEDDHLALLAYLNSSTACFWMKQVFMNKGGSGIGRGVQDEAWESRFQFDGTKLAAMPLPTDWRSLATIGRKLLSCAESYAALQAGAQGEQNLPEAPPSALDEVVGRRTRLQEELDFRVYRLFGLLDTEPAIASAVRPGCRFFEASLARDSRPTSWFERNGYPRPPADAKGLEALELPEPVLLIERPEYKRRWSTLDWSSARRDARAQLVAQALENQLAQLVRPVRLRELQSRTERAGDDYSKQEIESLVRENAVPYLWTFRYTDEGLANRSSWESTWALQRREDAGEKVEIPVPPKYDQKDYRDPIYWRLRGKLDVPKERFIAYPGAERDGDPSPIYGWAGWDHLQQATALAGLYHERKNEDGWGATEAGRQKLVPLLAGLLELVPWLVQWHNQPNDDLGGEGAGDWYGRYVEAEARSVGVGLDELRAWRPAATKARKRKDQA